MGKTGAYCPFAFTFPHLKNNNSPRKSHYLKKLTVSYGDNICAAPGAIPKPRGWKKIKGAMEIRHGPGIRAKSVPLFRRFLLPHRSGNRRERGEVLALFFTAGPFSRYG
jgi:hypothetical protein